MIFLVFLARFRRAGMQPHSHTTCTNGWGAIWRREGGQPAGVAVSVAVSVCRSRGMSAAGGEQKAGRASCERTGSIQERAVYMQGSRDHSRCRKKLGGGSSRLALGSRRVFQRRPGVWMKERQVGTLSNKGRPFRPESRGRAKRESRRRGGTRPSLRGRRGGREVLEQEYMGEQCSVAAAAGAAVAQGWRSERGQAKGARRQAENKKTGRKNKGGGERAVGGGGRQQRREKEAGERRRGRIGGGGG